MLQQLRLHLRRERSKILSFSFVDCLKIVFFFFSVITDHNKDLEVIELKVDIMNTEKKISGNLC